ncbi:hypothetical protein E3N88_31818 [Mikania micrantha]|uniref:Bromo domain-containing protein n=1 Tax=Mikania micrantha TaxID=192012 RepID=A0A5N6M6P4_9ASTR|nr:hypothetical protein E3N88_31818 [Mikania micrantha]
MTISDQERSPEDAQNSPPETAAWVTWEELLLAFAVNRFGTGSWDSISSELRKRSIHLTPHHCEQKYGELKRRFNRFDENDVVMDDGCDTTTATGAIPWIEELRKLRVLELQRELRNYDLYISSLQSKVKRLTEESEKTGGDTKKNSDLGHRTNENESEKTEQPTNGTPEPEVSGDDDSDRYNQSVNGSNGNLETGVEKSENVNENGASPVDTGDEKPESPAVVPEGEEPVKNEPGGEASVSPESIAESDMLSSANELRKERNDWVPRGSSMMNEQDQSTVSIPVRSLPLVGFLVKLQKLGSVVFERRLDRQEKLRYKNLIKQHIDYETLQTRLKEGWYSDGNDKFFRDLLLLVNNTLIFFPKQSPESTAAVDLRHLILNEMITKKKPKTDSKLSTDPSDSLLLKPNLTGSIAVCRKRSSITAKVAAGSSYGEKEQTGSRNAEKLVEENPRKSRESSPLFAKKKGKSPVNDMLDTKPGKKTKLSEAEEKKQSAAKFLNRMKRSNESLISTPERGGSGSSSGGDGKKYQQRKKNFGGRQLKEQGSPAKRSVGRPPKRAAASPPLAAKFVGKRNRELVDSETLGSKQMKKRSKK